MSDMPDNAEQGKPLKGAVLQFFGVVLLGLGLLNSMLALKGGLEPDWLNYILLALGGAILVGGVRVSGRTG